MCEPADAVNVLNRIHFKVASLAHITDQGSWERALINAVADSVRQDIEYAVKQIKAERERLK